MEILVEFIFLGLDFSLAIPTVPDLTFVRSVPRLPVLHNANNMESISNAALVQLAIHTS
jgi:hypothetical protein